MASEIGSENPQNSYTSIIVCIYLLLKLRNFHCFLSQETTMILH